MLPGQYRMTSWSVTGGRGYFVIAKLRLGTIVILDREEGALHEPEQENPQGAGRQTTTSP